MKYEYAVEEVCSIKEAKSLIGALSKEGWRLEFFAINDDDYYVIIMEREVPDVNPDA